MRRLRLRIPLWELGDAGHSDLRFHWLAEWLLLREVLQILQRPILAAVHGVQQSGLSHDGAFRLLCATRFLVLRGIILDLLISSGDHVFGVAVWDPDTAESAWIIFRVQDGSKAKPLQIL